MKVLKKVLRKFVFKKSHEISSIEECNIAKSLNIKNKYKQQKTKTTDIDEILLNLDEETITRFVDERLKYISKSDFIYNKQIQSEQELSLLTKEEVITHYKDLALDHHKVCRENEQFRGKNFAMLLKLKKMGVKVE